MTGFSLPGCPQFDWWLLTQQELYHRQVLETLAILGSYYESCREYRQASIYAQKEIEIEPWRETAHRRRMRALALNGERSEALRQYQSCRSILAQEMRIEPSQQTTELFESIRTERAPSLGDHQLLQGLPGPAPPVWVSVPSAARFVGFESELAQLESHLAHALSGSPRVVFISGEAGSGKTTLLTEFIQRSLGAHGDLLAAVGGCNAQFGYGDPYLPFRQALHLLSGDLEGIQSGGILGEEHAGRIWSALPVVLKILLQEGPDLVGAFMPLEAMPQHSHRLGNDILEAITQRKAQAGSHTGDRSAPGSQTGQTAVFDQFTRVLLAIARRYPLILALDDLQWADRGSLSLLFHLARSLGDNPVLLIGAYRPEESVLDQSGDRHPLQTLVNELLTQYGEMRLDLSKSGGWDFLNALLDSEPNVLDAAFRRELFQLTEGHPLFTVEQLRGMQESGGLVRDEAGRWEAGKELKWERIPARVEAVIAEHLARPSAECREILDSASVQGETFIVETLAMVLGKSEAHIVEHLSGELCRQHRLVFAEGLQRLGSTTLSRYRFRHALYQRQLYQNLDPVLKTRLHQATGEALEKRYAQQSGVMTAGDASASRLAFHFDKAGLWEKAILYHQKAGNLAYRLAANEDAITHYNQALKRQACIPESPEQNRQELLLLISLISAINAAKGYTAPELRCLFDRADGLTAKSGEADLVSQVLYLSGTYHYGRAEYQRTLDTGEQLLELSQDQSIPWMSDIANFLLGNARLNMGDLTLAKAHFQKINKAGDSDQISYVSSPVDRVCLLFPAFLSWTLWLLGYPDQALDLNQQLISRVRMLGYPNILAFTLGMSCVIHAFRNEIGQLQEYAQELTTLAIGKGFGLYQGWGRIFLGRALVEKGNVKDGLDTLQDGLDAYRATGQIGVLTLMLAVQVQAFAIAGQSDNGLKTLSEALKLANESGERFFESELHRLQGELLLAASGAEDEIESCFQKALQIAREQNARSLELRATTNLARLWSRQGKQEDARRMLGEIFDWFREGFDTPDLQAAKALLEALTGSE